MTHYELTCPDGSFEVQVDPSAEGWRTRLDDDILLLRLVRGGGNLLIVEVGGKPVAVTLFEASSQKVDLILEGERLVFQRPAATLRQGAPTTPLAISTQNLMVAPMPGKVIGALVKEGERVKAGDPIIILESMKMEIAVRVDRDAEVSEILVEEGMSVKRGQGLVRLSA
jgi:biotin carboxyl carrier protein